MRRHVAYLVILIASLLIELMRIPLIPQWKTSHHIGAFFFQSITLCFMWWILRRVNHFFEQKFPYRQNVVKRMLLQVVACVVLLSPVLIVVNVLSDILFPPLDFMTPQFKAVAFVLFVLVVTLINFSFYGAYFFNQWRFAIEEKARLSVQAAETEREKTLMLYQHLRNQVNPHFLFNTLTSLDGLILSDPSLASKFVRHLAKVYRYVLEQPEGEVVSVEQEFAFINHYISMLKMKYKDALDISVNLPQSVLDKGIGMVTSQMLIDNAIKHNVVHINAPLSIQIDVDGPYLVFTNNKQIKKQIEVSTKQGLKHLQQFYSYLSPVPVEVLDTASHFQVKLPLL